MTPKFLTGALLAIMMTVNARGQSTTWTSIDCGGGTASAVVGPNTFTASGTFAQPDSGVLVSGEFAMYGGFRPGATNTPMPCAPDLTNNAIIDIDDLVVLITRWGACATPCPPACHGDANHNCVVDIDDLVMVITQWGNCP